MIELMGTSGCREMRMSELKQYPYIYHINTEEFLGVRTYKDGCQHGNVCRIKGTPSPARRQQWLDRAEHELRASMAGYGKKKNAKYCRLSGMALNDLCKQTN